MSQARFVSLLIRFHLFFLMLPFGLVRQLRLVFVAVEKRSPGRVSAVFTIFEFFVDSAFGFGHNVTR